MFSLFFLLILVGRKKGSSTGHSFYAINLLSVTEKPKLVGMVIVCGYETRTEGCMTQGTSVVCEYYTRFMMALTYGSYAFEIWKVCAYWSDLAMT